MCISRAANSSLWPLQNRGRCVRPSVVRKPFSPKPLVKSINSPAATKKSTSVVVPAPSFNLPLGLLAIAGAEYAADLGGLAAFTGVLGLFLGIQATRVRFRFDDNALEVVVGGKEDEETENKFVGGANRWSYDSFINWELWWPGFPVLTYFKESQTRPEGQIHFFPVIFNGKELYDVMVERCGPSATSGPRK